jgi:hypothetical protein
MTAVAVSPVLTRMSCMVYGKEEDGIFPEFTHRGHTVYGGTSLHITDHLHWSVAVAISGVVPDKHMDIKVRKRQTHEKY